MRAVVILFVTFCLNCEAQIIYFSSGLGTNSGAQVYPYTGSSYLSIPTLLEAEVKMEFKNFADISLFGQRNLNKKGGDSFLSGTSTNALSHYLGLRIGESLNQNNGVINRKFGIGCSAAFGSELVKWNDSNTFIFSPSQEISGKDEFKHLQIGVFSFLNWEKSQFNFKLSLSILKDFIIYSSRQMDDPSNSDLSMYERFNHKGLLSFNLQGGIGVRITR